MERVEKQSQNLTIRRCEKIKQSAQKGKQTAEKKPNRQDSGVYILYKLYRYLIVYCAQSAYFYYYFFRSSLQVWRNNKKKRKEKKRKTRTRRMSAFGIAFIRTHTYIYIQCIQYIYIFIVKDGRGGCATLGCDSRNEERTQMNAEPMPLAGHIWFNDCCYIL